MNLQSTISDIDHTRNEIPVDQLDQSFLLQADPTIGVELELMIVDEISEHPLPLFEEISEALPPEIQRYTQGEIFACQIEYASRPQKTLRSLDDELQGFVTAASTACKRHHAKLLWSGNHPAWKYDESMVRDCARSRLIQQRFAALMPRLLTCGVHFHVAVARDKAIQVVDRLQRFLPLLIALSANSPLADQADSGYRSQRALVWANEFPVCGLSEPFGDWQGFLAQMRSLQEMGLIESQKDLYYFVRPTRYGTVEVRCCDVPMNIDQIIALAALVQVLVVGLQRDLPTTIITSDDLAGELNRAMQDGPEALLTDHCGRVGSALSWMSRLRLELDTIACELNTDAALLLGESILAENGSTRQLRQAPAMVSVCEHKRSPVKLNRHRTLVAAVATAAVAMPVAAWLGTRLW